MYGVRILGVDPPHRSSVGDLGALQPTQGYVNPRVAQGDFWWPHVVRLAQMRADRSVQPSTNSLKLWSLWLLAP